MKAGKFKLPTQEKLLYMNEENWIELKHKILKKYYIHLFGEESEDTLSKEHKLGNVEKGRD